ncbi:hypothetical protein IT568_12230 [bacterium]|nr:hypothetical protein [bacterium]
MKILILILCFVLPACSERIFVGKEDFGEKFPKGEKFENVSIGDVLYDKESNFKAFEVLEKNDSVFVAVVWEKKDAKPDTIRFRHSDVAIYYEKFSKTQTVSSVVTLGLIALVLSWEFWFR